MNLTEMIQEFPTPEGMDSLDKVELVMAIEEAISPPGLRDEEIDYLARIKRDYPSAWNELTAELSLNDHRHIENKIAARGQK